MLDPHHPLHPLHSSIVHIRDMAGAIVGAGFLAAPELVCTCAHVVADALHIPRKTEQLPEGEVRLDFPFLGEAEIHACIQVWIRMEPNDKGGDIAVLRLTSAPPPGAQSARLLLASNLSGRDFAAYGFPSTADVGQWAYGTLHDRLANGYVQLEGTTTQGYRIQQGYSGTPVWDSNGRGVVGMVVAAEQDPEAKVAFLIPNDLILHACPDIKSSVKERGLSRRTVIVGLTGLVVFVGAAGGSLLLLPPPHVGTTLYTYLGHHHQYVWSVAWSPNSKRIVSSSEDGIVQVWDAADGGNAFTYRGHPKGVMSVAWSPDGKRIASASWDHTVQIWNATDGGNVFTYRGHSQSVWSVTWSPDGNRIASGSDDQTVQVWDVASGDNVFTYLGHSRYERSSVAWSPDGKRIASGSLDGTVQVFEV